MITKEKTLWSFVKISQLISKEMNDHQCGEFVCGYWGLKGLCHEDVAILGQFRIRAITWCLYQNPKCSFTVVKKISNTFGWVGGGGGGGRGGGEGRRVTFAGITSKREKVGPTFWSFSPCPFSPSVATDDRKQFQCPSTVLNNKTGLLISVDKWEDHFLF